MNLRRRILQSKINCQPWKFYRGEIMQLCVSGQCLFSNSGLNWDVLEIELKDEGWIGPDESLWDLLKTEKDLRRKIDEYEKEDDQFDETWTDEDYEYFYNNLKEKM